MARSFNGSTDQLVTGSFSLPAGSCTVTGWVMMTASQSGFRGLFGQSGGTSYFELYVNTGALCAFTNTTGNGAIGINPSSVSLSLNVWGHCAMRFNSSTGVMDCFLNAVSGGTQGSTPGTIVGASDPFVVGYDSNTAGRNFQGRFADVAYWSVALSSGELSALANGARAWMIRPNNLIGYWPLDGLQSPEPDLSGNKRNGTLTGTALAAGPPMMQFTPRWPLNLASAAASAVVFRRTASSLGTRTGSRQVWG